MKMHYAIGAAILAVGVGVGSWFFLKYTPWLPAFGVIRPSINTVNPPYPRVPLSDTYRNEHFRFSIDIPEGFTVGELPKDERGGVAIILQDTEGNGIQIYLVPDESAKENLTEADIRAAIPDLVIENPQVVTIGPRHTGLAFISNNDAFGGASREVWFYFRGTLYQISTYAHLDSLLQAMFATWYFY